MKITVLNYIEVSNYSNEWAVEIKDCKIEMQPIEPSFIFLHNEIYCDEIFVLNTLTDIIPEKIINGVTGSIQKDFIEVGFWRVKNKKIKI
jgi:hypothetical protein